jgi:hypothetical protein
MDNCPVCKKFHFPKETEMEVDNGRNKWRPCKEK